MEARKTSESPSMGIRGIWATIANIGAVTLVCCMFYQSQQQFFAQAHEDRAMFREELGRLHADSRAIAESVAKLALELRDKEAHK